MIEAYEQTVYEFFGASAIEAAKVHAIAQFPKESCGFIAQGVYFACENQHEDPTQEFEIQDDRYDQAVAAGLVTAIIHSHPYGPLVPSELDMSQQIATGVPWVIISLNEKGVHKMVAWGGNLPIAPVIGRPFIHGIFDCYALVRDVFRLGKDGMKAQGISWPHDPIELPEVARADNWWKGEGDLYVSHLAPVGFKQITRSEAREGDGFLCALGDARTNPNKRLCHAGLIVERDQVLHHFTNHLSARKPAGMWAKVAEMWVRYEGPSK
jgi:proteasome lid subunit RPN8/RPN11